MNVLEAMTSRASVRAFLDRPVAAEILVQLLETARWAPSAVNTQPWHVHVVRSPTKEQLGSRILAARADEQPQNPDYAYYPGEWYEPYKTRRKACGQALYGQMNVSYGDTAKRLALWNQNYHFFHAPVGLIFVIDSRLEKGSWLDMGLFLENIMLGARAFDLATCPLASLAEYPDIVREVLHIDPLFHVVCGMAVGYPDLEAQINQYRTEREPLANFVTWHG